MTNEIDQTKSTGPQTTPRRNFVKKWAAEGMVAVRINATFFGVMTPKNRDDAGGAELSIGVTEIDQDAVANSIKQAGHSEVTMRGGALVLVRPDQIPNNVLQKLPDESLLHITTASDRSLAQAQKSAVTLKAKIFSTNAEPPEIVKTWFTPIEELENAA